MPVPTRIAATLLLAGSLAACGAEADDRSGPTSPSTGSYPVTVENCGADVTFEADPERVVLLKSSAVPFLHDLGVMDRVTARAGQYPDDYYDEETLAELDEIPLLTDELDSSGHLQISKEVVISQEPDLVLGQVDNLSRDTLDAVGIPLLEEPALCGTGGEPAFDDVYDQLELYGTVFGREAQAEEAIADLRDELAGIESEVGEGSGRTAAVLYPTVGGGTTYAYGTGSMAHPQLEAAGLENVFADVDERVFEVTLEELLGRDPDVLVLLHSEGEPGPVEQAITDLPGADQLTAVRNGDVMTQLFNFTEPPSPLAFDGLARIVERFGTS
ncbi:ABC transporter substrate-binding protein [Nocardioides oleivorans]|uniref:ABC transporter substrate-binding protein n=1 Tax=Nocardioides oleivorans TaxID=273676 RepID=A0A4Q2RSR4_9ACTN|nr:ABC transporter substrate-binding protein [Nocardioides oleivorans]RYB92091.1 ABC transporter substrate-binding protein [Nocardioides oleivorans]